MQRCGHLSRDECAGSETEFLTKSSTNGRGSLHHHSFRFVLQSLPDELGRVFLFQGTDRANHDALSTVRTDGLSQIFILRWSDEGGKAPMVRIHQANTLNIVADGHTSAAKNAFGTVSYDGCCLLYTSPSPRDGL